MSKKLKININDNKLLTKITIATSILVVLVVIAFILAMRRTTYDTVLYNMKEVATHDKQSIENYLESNWNEINNIKTGTQYYDVESIEDLQNYLNLRKSESEIFNDFVLITDDGTVYDSKYIISNINKLSRVAEAVNRNSERDRFVVKTGGTGASYYAESKMDMVLFITKADDFELAGQKIDYIGGYYKTSALQSQLEILSKDDEGGYSTIIDRDGDFIANVEEASIGTSNNLFEDIEDGRYKLEGTSLDEVKRSVKSDKFTSFTYVNADTGKKYIATQTSMDDEDWTFIHNVPYSRYTDKTRLFTVTIVVSMLVIALLVIGLSFLLLRSNTQRVASDVEARTRNEFLNNMSHEIRTPLNGIVGLNHLMMLHAEEPDKVREYNKKLEATSRYLLALINDILDISKMQAGKMDIQNIPFSLSYVVDNAYTMYAGAAQEKGISLIVSRNIEHDCVYGDATRLEQILLNIISNAIKYTNAGGLVDIFIEQEDAADDVVITRFAVSDNGIGMSREFQKHIFEEFSQDRNATTNSIKGTGLGMTVTKELTELMNGTVVVDSEEGVGSTFTVVIPFHKAERAAVDAFSAVSIDTDTTDTTKRVALNVLIAEDNELNAEILIDVLEEEGMKTALAHNGQEAVDMFTASEIGEYDLILMDAQMPVMDGYAAAGTIRQLERSDAKTVKIFACTANTSLEDREKAAAAGMDDFVSKPIDVKTLMTLINTTMGGVELR